MKKRIVIIGASVTGVYAVTELVRNKFPGEIILIDKKDVLPYNPYPLTKEWMMDLDEDEPPLLKKEEYYKENNINLKLSTRVQSVDWEKKVIKTGEGEEISYDYLLIATGSKLRKVDLPGDDARGVFYLRDFDDARAIKDWVKKSEKVLIIGTGFIGLEFASTFSQMGKKVSVLVRSGKPLEKILGEDMSDYFTKMHEEHGINFIFDEESKEFIKDDKGNISQVITKNDKKIETDMLIVAVGVQPNLSFHIEGLDMDRGAILVNEYGETSLPDIYAGGDIVLWPYRDKMLHIEHWENAWGQGTSIAKNIMEEKSNIYKSHPYFWTDQYDESFEYLGNARSWDRTLVRGSLDDREWTIAYVDENSYPLAILFANKAEEREDIEALLDKNQPLDEKKFRDLSIELKDI